MGIQKKWNELDEKELVLVASEVRKKGFLEADKVTENRGQNDRILELLEKLVELLERMMEKNMVVLEKVSTMENRLYRLENIYRLQGRNGFHEVNRVIKQYMARKDIYHASLNDIFLELLAKFEQVKGSVRDKYKKEDKSYIGTLVRLGRLDDFLSFVEKL